MKRQMNRIVMLMALLFTSTALTGCFFTTKMMGFPKIRNGERQTEQQTEAETREEETEEVEEQEETGVRGIPKTQEANEQQGSESQSTAPDTDGTKESAAVSAAQEEQIRHIAEVYDRTIQNQGNTTRRRIRCIAKIAAPGLQRTDRKHA